MPRIILLVCALLILGSGQVLAEKAESFEQAQKLSAQTGKPILLEFVHED